MVQRELTGQGVYLGRQGDDANIQVYVDLTDWLEEYGAGSGVMLFTSPDGKVWPLYTEVDADAKKMTGEITQAETARFGNGVIEARWMTGGTMMASEKFNAYILPQAFRGEVPRHITPSWVQDLILGFEAHAGLLDEVREASRAMVSANFVTPEMYGAKADGVTDDTQAILKAFQACKEKGAYLVCPGKNYLTTVDCVLNFEQYEFNVILMGRAEYIKFIGAPNKMSAIRIDINKAGTVIFQDFKGISAFVGFANTLKVCAGTTSGCAFNNFRGAFAENLTLEGLVSRAWVNENKFYDFRVVNLSIIGIDYNHNNNRFYDMALESGTINLNGATSNYIQLRGEGGYTKNYTKQRNNIIEKTFVDAIANKAEPVYDGNYSFSANSQEKYLSMLEIFRLDKTNMTLEDEKNFRIASWHDMAVVYIRMRGPMTVLVNAADTLRFYYSVLDAEGNNITTNDPATCGAVCAGAAYSVSQQTGEARWGVSQNVTGCVINCYDADSTHWLRVLFNAGNADYVAPAFSVYLKALMAPDYYIGASVLDESAS